MLGGGRRRRGSPGGGGEEAAAGAAGDAWAAGGGGQGMALRVSPPRARRSGGESGSGGGASPNEHGRDDDDDGLRTVAGRLRGTLQPLRRTASAAERRRRESSLHRRRKYTEHTRWRPMCCGVPEDEQGRCFVCRCAASELPFWLRAHSAVLLAAATMAAALLASGAGLTFCEMSEQTWPDTPTGHVECTNKCRSDCFRLSAACRVVLGLFLVYCAASAAAAWLFVRRRLERSRRATRAVYWACGFSWPPALAWMWFSLDTATMFTFSRRFEFGLTTTLVLLHLATLITLAAVTQTARVSSEHLLIDSMVSRAAAGGGLGGGDLAEALITSAMASPARGGGGGDLPGAPLLYMGGDGSGSDGVGGGGGGSDSDGLSDGGGGGGGGGG